MHVTLCSASNFNLTFLFHRSYSTKLSKAKAGGLYDLWSEWQNLFYVEMKPLKAKFQN